MLQSVTHRTLDGSTITIQAPVELDDRFSTYARIDFGGDVQEFGAGPGDFGVTDAYDIGVKTFDETYQFQAGTLRLGTAYRSDPELRDRWTYLVAVWEGQRFSLSTYVANAPDSGPMLAVLNRLRLVESPEGLVATPAEPDRTPVVKVSLMKAVPRLQLLDVRRPQRTELRAIPNWSGRQVAGGELFLLNSHERPSGFVLAGETAITYIRPDPDDDIEALLATVSSLRVDAVWTAPNGRNEHPSASIRDTQLV